MSRGVAAPARRMFSAGASQEQIFAEVQKWRKISAGGIVFCGLTAIYVFATEEHGHPLNQSLSYMRVREKPFPWSECDECGFFEGDCWAACQKRKEEWLKKKNGGN